MHMCIHTVPLFIALFSLYFPPPFFPPSPSSLLLSPIIYPPPSLSLSLSLSLSISLPSSFIFLQTSASLRQTHPVRGRRPLQQEATPTIPRQPPTTAAAVAHPLRAKTSTSPTNQLLPVLIRRGSGVGVVWAELGVRLSKGSTSQ